MFSYKKFNKYDFSKCIARNNTKMHVYVYNTKEDNTKDLHGLNGELTESVLNKPF